jgi:hypothetical protein
MGGVSLLKQHCGRQAREEGGMIAGRGGMASVGGVQRRRVHKPEKQAEGALPAITALLSPFPARLAAILREDKDRP